MFTPKPVHAARLLVVVIAVAHLPQILSACATFGPFVVPCCDAVLFALVACVARTSVATVVRTLRVAIAWAPLVIAVASAIALLATAESVSLALATIAVRFWHRTAVSQRLYSPETRTVLAGCFESVHSGVGGWWLPLVSYLVC